MSLKIEDPHSSHVQKSCPETRVSQGNSIPSTLRNVVVFLSFKVTQTNLFTLPCLNCSNHFSREEPVASWFSKNIHHIRVKHGCHEKNFDSNLRGKRKYFCNLRYCLHYMPDKMLYCQKLEISARYRNF